MAWAVPNYSRSQVDAAGRTFIDPTADEVSREKARAVISNWRSSHSFPLNTLQVNLRGKVAKVEADPLVAQRIKRLPSIQQKLRRFPGMSLSRMQDIGGCRGVVSDIWAVGRVVDAFHDGQHAHVLHRENDYILRPQPSGYRGHHLVYRYQSKRMQTYKNLSIEVQVRTRTQHA